MKKKIRTKGKKEALTLRVHKITSLQTKDLKERQPTWDLQVDLTNRSIPKKSSSTTLILCALKSISITKSLKEWQRERPYKAYTLKQEGTIFSNLLNLYS